MTDLTPAILDGGTRALLAGMAIAIATLAAVCVALWRAHRAVQKARLDDARACEAARIAELRACIEIATKSTDALRELQPILEHLTEERWQRRRPSRS